MSEEGTHQYIAAALLGTHACGNLDTGATSCTAPSAKRGWLPLAPRLQMPASLPRCCRPVVHGASHRQSPPPPLGRRMHAALFTRGTWFITRSRVWTMAHICLGAALVDSCFCCPTCFAQRCWHSCEHNTCMDLPEPQNLFRLAYSSQAGYRIDLCMHACLSIFTSTSHD